MIKQIAYFYIDGFRSMRVGKKLWLIIFIKLFIMFGILKIFFFPDYLQENFSSDQARAEHVLDNITVYPK
jgi:hypothetical protein